MKHTIQINVRVESVDQLKSIIGYLRAASQQSKEYATFKPIEDAAMVTAQKAVQIYGSSDASTELRELVDKLDQKVAMYALLNQLLPEFENYATKLMNETSEI